MPEEKIAKLFAGLQEFAQLPTVEDLENFIAKIVGVMHGSLEVILGRLDELKKGDADLGTRIDDVQEEFARGDAELAKRIDEIELTPGEKGDQGERGADGIARDGKDGQDGSPDTPEQIRNKLEKLKGKDRLDVDAIDGLDDLVKKMTPDAGTPRRSIFGVPSRGFFLYVAGIKFGLVSNLNIVGGDGVSVAYSKVDGQDTLTINASGSGIIVETPPEAVDAVNTVFTVSGQPKWIVQDGITLYEGAGYSYAAGVITTDLAPSQFIRAII